jgi:hypothetical protein
MGGGGRMGNGGMEGMGGMGGMVIRVGEGGRMGSLSGAERPVSWKTAAIVRSIRGKGRM